MAAANHSRKKASSHHVINGSTLRWGALCAALAAASPITTLAADGRILEEVEVVARKKTTAESAQDIPIAVSAFSAEQLEARGTRTISSLSFSMPNVSLDDIGTIKGTANFSIRGLGINSSIASIDPTVGVFVDGIYLGMNSGVVVDMFDLEGIEVLRGPQGLLFGRNVTGGAVLIKTRRPSSEFSADVKASVTERMDKTLAGSISGPLIDGVLAARLTAYWNDDDGWFENDADGEDFGQAETVVVRPSLTWTPTERTDLTVRFEHGETDGDGPASQNRRFHDRDSFNFIVNDNTFGESEWNQATAELNVDVSFGDGVITNVFGWREYDTLGRSDIDGTISTLFHATFLVDQDQLSNELRYSGRFFDRVDLTAGLFWFEQDILSLENRVLNNATVNSTLGGTTDVESRAVFTQADIDLTDAWTLTLGLRYTEEEKSAAVATFNPAASVCDLERRTCNYNFRDDADWSDVSPKVGMSWQAAEDLQFYGFWAKGFRSGGYNIRSTNAAALPGPFDPEEQNSFEIGMKADWLGRTLRTNLALFHNRIDDMQREINLPSGSSGVVQIIRNTADATIQGAELELQALVGQTLLLTGSIGYVDGEYDTVRFDISGDNVVNEIDRRLDIPRLAPLTWGVGVEQNIDVASNTLNWRIAFNHRDGSPYTDNNRGQLNAADMLDASIAWLTMNDDLRIALFGTNLLDEPTEGGDTQLPFGPGQTFSPLNKGRVIGIEARYAW